MKSITYEEAVFLQLDGYIRILQEIVETDDEVIIGNADLLDKLLNRIFVADVSVEFGRELIELKDAFNINLDHETTKIVFFRD